MDAAGRVFKNSIFLIIQALALNILSIFATGYIARTLGQTDFGKFNFAFAFVALFTPLADLGLRSVVVRSIAENRGAADDYVGKMILLRAFTAGVSLIAVMAAVNLLKYPSDTKLIVYIAGIILALNTFSLTFQDTFTAFEKISYIAWVHLISGITITALSIFILFIGYRLVGLTLVYLCGNFVGLAISAFVLLSRFFNPKLGFDSGFWRRNAVQGQFFFWSNIFGAIMGKLDVTLLSKMLNDAAVGIYTASTTLIYKLIFVPDAIAHAFFPTFSALNLSSKEEARVLLKKYISIMLIIGFPMAVGIALLSKQIILLIYGPKYQDSALILQIGIWAIPLSGLIYIMGYGLISIHLESKVMQTSFVAMVSNIILNLILIKPFGEVGSAISLVAARAITVFHMSILASRRWTGLVSYKTLGKIISANVCMGLLVGILYRFNLIFVISASATLYIACLLVLRAVNIREFMSMGRIFIKG